MSLPLNQIVSGDCLEVMKTFPTESIDCIVTDPPYGLGKKIIGDESLDTYHKVLPELFRILKYNTFHISFAPIGDIQNFLTITSEYFSFVWLGFIHYRNIQRLLHSPLGRTKLSLFVVYQKGQAKRKYAIRDVIEFVYNGKNIQEFCHIAQKPIDALLNILKFVTEENDIVLDPFCGSGTTCIAAQKLCRNFIGIEIEPKYCEIARKRLVAIPERLDTLLENQTSVYQVKVKT